MEIYKVIEENETYIVSNYGNIKNDATGELLKGTIDKDGYKVVKLEVKCYKVHRLVAQAFHENPQNKPVVDHIDGNKLNNHATNLRWATPSENAMNKKAHKNNSSGFKGVNFNKTKQKWEAQIQINGIKIHIGLFITLEEAANARQQKANELFGNFTHKSEKQ